MISAIAMEAPAAFAAMVAASATVRAATTTVTAATVLCECWI
jgi:hypothetical protein